MNKPPAQSNLSRRQFLALLAAAGVTATSGYALFEYTPWLNYEQQANQSRQPFQEGAAVAIQMRELVGYATLAASGHNTQPWTFAIINQTIEIHPDYSRHLPVVDPSDRELWISLGCALENLLVAARAVGYTAEVTYPNAVDFIRVVLTADMPQAGALFTAIPLRQNTRSIYDGQLIPNSDLHQLQALPLEPGVVLHIVTAPNERATVLEYVNQGNLRQYADKAFVDELTHWLRFNKKEALASLDGLYSPCAGNPEVPRWLGQIVVNGTKPAQQADADAEKLRSSPGAVVVASASDDKTSWVRTDQVYERMALTLTSLNIKSAFLNITNRRIHGCVYVYFLFHCYSYPIMAVALVSAAFGFLNVFNDQIGMDIEGGWAAAAQQRLDIDGGRHGIGGDQNPDNLAHELPTGGPSAQQMMGKYTNNVGDVAAYSTQQFGVVLPWMRAFPERLRPLHAALYGEAMQPQPHSILSAELKHILAYVSHVEKRHSALTASEAFIAHHVSADKPRTVQRVQHAFAIASGRGGNPALFSDAEQAALRLAYLSAQTPLVTPRRVVQPIMDHFDAQSCVELFVVCGVAGLV